MTLQELLAQQYAGGVGPVTRAVDPYDGRTMNYADVTYNGAPLRLNFDPNAGTYYAGLTELMNQDGKPGMYVGDFGQDGALQGVRWKEDRESWIDKALDVAPYAVLGAAAYGGGLFGGAGGAGTTAGTTAAPLEAGLANVGSGWAGGTGLGGAAMSAAPLEAGLAGVGSTWAGGGGMSSLLSNPNLWLTGAQVVGGLLGADASRDASNAQVQASQAAIDESRRQYDTTRADLAPWRQAGVGALGGLAGLLGLNGAQPVDVMKMDPGFRFAQEQGEQAINRAARARGGFDSGATLKDLLRFNEGLSSQRFNDVYNRFAGVAGTGQNATNTTAQFGAQNASNVGNLLTGAGNARAAGIVGGANAINNTIGGVTNLWQQNSLLDMLTRRA